MVGSQSHIYSSSDSDTGKKKPQIPQGPFAFARNFVEVQYTFIKHLCYDYHRSMLHNKLAFYLTL